MAPRTATARPRSARALTSRPGRRVSAPASSGRRVLTVHRSYCEGDACGDIDAGGYREYLSDVWYWDLNTWLDPGDAGGKNTWEMITSGAGFAGRGGHSLSVLEMLPKDGSGVQ